MNNVTGNCTDQLLPNQYRKVFVQRDYSSGLDVKFETKIPAEIEDRLDQHIFERFVSTLNSMYSEAEQFGCNSVCETLTSCFTCHLAHFCMPSQYQKELKNIALFLKDQNEKVFKPAGLWVTDPIERGCRVIEILKFG